MGFRFLLLIISLVTLSRAKDLRPPASQAVDRRSAPDALLGEIFNDPSATSLTKLNLEDSDNDNDDFSGSGSELWSGSAQTAPTQSSTDASLTSPNVTSQGADAKLPSTEDQSQNTVVQTEENDKTSNDKSNTAFLPAQTQSTLETVPDYSPAALVGQQSPGFDDNSLYDPTIVKKTDVPVGPHMFSNPLVNNTADLQGTLRSAIPQAPVPAPQAPAIRKSAVPFRGSFPLQLHKYSPYSKLMKKNMIEKAKAGLNQNAGRKSVIPGLTEAGGLRPLSINLPQGQQQQDATNNQGYPQPQMQGPAMDVNPAQMTFGDQPQASPTAQPFAPVPSKVQPLADQAPAESPLQNPQQVLDQAQGGVPQAPEQAFAPQAPEQAFAPQAPEQAFAPQVADPSNMQMQSPENVAAAFPINTTMPDTMVGALPQQTPGIPAQGVQAVPVYQGLQPKKPVIEEEDCDDQFDTCPEMAKNDYCTKYPDLMKIQCKKSCHFCEIKHNNEESGSGYDEYDSGSASLYYADEVNSGSGSSDWDDDSDDDEDPGYRKSGIPAPIHKVLMAKFAADSGSASGASGMGESSVSDEDIIQTSGSGEAGSGSQKKDEVSEAASGSGEALPVTVASPTPGTAEIGSGSGSLAEDLATGTVSRANEKHSSIPRPPAPQVSVYPKIDLKEIAKAVNMYRGVALKMLGEALEGAAEQKEEELSKKSHIPLPPATDILQRMGFPIGYDESSKRNMVPNPMQDTNMMMAPNYGIMGYGNNGYAYNFPQQVGNEPLADFYAQYQQQPNFARSGIMASPEEQAEEQQSEDEGAAQADQSEAIQPENDQQQENTTGAEVQDKPETPKNNTDEKDKKDKIVDPFEYVRNMGKGASMEPIRSKAASGLISASHSDPLILWKSSQIQKLAALAKKKSEIPQPGSQTLMPAVSDSQFEQEVLQSPEQQFRSDIPEQNITMGGLPDMSGQTASVFPQSIPQSEALTQSPADELAARSQILQGQALPSLEQPQQQGLLARLIPQQANTSSADFKNLIPQGRSGNSLGVVVSHHAPVPGSFPLTLRKIVPGMVQKKDELYKQVQEEINKNSVPSAGAVDMFASQVANNPAVPQPAQMSQGVSRSDLLSEANRQNAPTNKPLPEPAQVTVTPGASRSDLSQAANSLPTDDNNEKSVDSTENAATSINEAFTGPSIFNQDQHSADPLFGSLNSKITTSLDNSDETPSDDPMDKFFNPEVQISGKIPESDNADDGIADPGASRDQVSKTTDISPGTEKGTTKGKISTPSPANLPPLNHGNGMAPASPPLNHNVEIASSLPPLNHAEEHAANLPPLLHGVEQAGNLPPLNHGSDALQSFSSLPPLNHGDNEAAVLPPLMHGIEQAKHTPSASFEKQSSQNVDALSAFTSQVENAAPSSDNGEMIQSYVGKPPQSPPLEHAYPLSHDNEALLPPLNHQQLPPLNHNDLVSTETSSYTGSDVNSFSSPGQGRSSPAPPIYPFTIPPEGGQGNHGYHGYQETENNQDALKTSSQASARGSLPSQSPYYPFSQANTNPEPVVGRQWFPEGGNPYPIPLPPEGSQNDQLNTGNTQGMFDSQLFSEPSQFVSPQLSAGWKKDNDGKDNKPRKPCEGDEFCPYPFYPVPLPPEGQQSDQTHQPNTNSNANPNSNGNIGKKNLIRPKPDLQCGAGWTGALGDFGSFCYKEIFERKSWDNAHQTCKGLGGELFSVTNAYEQRFIENFTNIESWLGYRDKSRDGTWTWSDSSLSVFTNWDSSAKDDHGKGRDCVLLSSKEGKWKDASCSQTHEYLCKKKPEDCGKGWKKLTLNSVRGCYKLFEEPKTWENSLVSCMDEQASLASILSDDEETMISQVYSKSDFWIGYNDIDNEGDWVWSDRMTSSYTNWDDKSPNNGGVSCAIVTSTGKWHDEPCQSQFSFICKKPSPKGPHHPLNDATLTQEVEKFVSNKSLLNPDIDTSVTIFGSHSVTPQYLWTVQKISNSRIHGSNRIASHGNVKPVDGGLQLNGVDSWLDAGDFYGQCLGDPDLCIKGFSYALQLNFDDDALSYNDKRYVLDSSGNSRGVSIYIHNGSLYYKVVTSTKEWQLSMELVTNEWQDIVLTWKKEEGLMLYVNGAFRDSLKDGTETSLIPNKQARLTIGRKSGNPPFKYTRMYISSLYAFTRFLAPEDVPYVFTFDNTVVPRYMWLLPKLQDKKITGSPDIEVHGPVRAVDGGVHLDGKESFLKVGTFDGKCLHDPSKCPNGLSLSCKLKFNRIVRTYKEPHYILDSGGHQKGTKGLSAYLLNNNLYFSVAMSTDEDTLTWTVRTSIFTVRWQRVVLSWSLSDGLWLYTDSQFRGWTKTPKSVPRDVVSESADFIVGRKNVGPEYTPAEFSIGSLAIFPRFLEKKDVEKIYGGKKMPYPGLIREVWKELPGKSISKLKDDPYYPNDPSLIEIIENFDSPFDIDKDYGSRVKGYFVAPETGNYTFYMSGSQSGELWMSSTESQQNLTKMVSLDQATGHNQWNKYAGQSSKSVTLEAGKYYYIVGLQKGTESTDSLSAGVRLPSGRFMRPITKEILQWRMPGDPFAGVIREVWQDIPGYRIMDLTSNPNFPNNPSSIEVLDKFDAPHNVDDNYGSRIRGFFKAPENGLYRFFLAADTTGELWLSFDESEKNLKKIVAINGWTAHNEWLKFPEQKSERIHLKKGKYYYLEAYQKSDKLADCVSVAVELPSGHFEGPIKRVHLSWRLPDGRTGPGPSSEEEAIPKPVGLYPLNKAFGSKDAGPNHENGVLSNVELASGPDGLEDGAYEFKGTADSFVEIPNDGKMDTQDSMTILANIYPTGSGGPILNYKTDGWGVHLWQFESTELFVRFVHRNGVFHKPIASRVLLLNEWNQVGATYDNTTGVAQLWHNGKMVKSRNIGQIKLATQYPIRIGARDGDERRFAGKISCLQIYDKALDEQQIGNLKSCPVKAKPLGDNALESGDGSGSGDWDEHDFDSSAVSISHNAGKYDKDEEADDEIQGSESTSGNKCDPEPCENGAKCIRDNKRMDGYRCKCTSDFTGRNCQVSKPDAENPIVKKAKIPKPELKTGTEDYQKNSSSLNLILENLPEEKKEDVLLLFQKVGCYKDENVKHDLPDKATVKSVTQEDCVRACALEEKGYSYFGLQDADKCFCGHRYGKYGKADDAQCNMPCKGNDKENCGGNATNMVYFFGLGTNYTVTTLTGDVEGADTDAKVYITLYGEKGDSGFRKLDTTHFSRGKNDTNTLVLPDLGKLRQVRILHDNSGSTPSWFLQKVTVKDENGRVYEFPCKEWLSETQGGGKTERLLRLQHS
ncbi:uncharacterized protein LOC113674731 isoform X3 [Pocillopora damicornis]|uniref:uncharacterized protein LOC113674731 isoform X3 n=1 Tax=Pocillopora damicornis TaxID=46731 RepID=UPI000F555B9E|nr:uncharacterized protein LOC113674731 isoform X3 [Pocillopora damicornis]